MSLDFDPRFFDYCSEHGAHNLAHRIERFWQEKGYPKVKVWPKQITEHVAHLGGRVVWGVKSNLVNGLPPQ